MELSSAIWDATKSLGGYVKKKAAYVFDLEDNLKLLKEKGEKLEDKKKDVEALVEEQVQRTHQVSGWLKRVDDVQEEIKKIQDHGDKQIQNKCLCKCCPSNCMSSYKLGKNVAKILTTVHELDTEGGRFCKDFIAFKRQWKSNNEMPCGETVGLDAMFGKVWKSIEEENVGIIGLYGMGGVGKTTLLQKINNELAKRSDFYIIWVVVSKIPNLDSVMDCIRKVVGIGDDIWKNCSNREIKAAEIYRVLKKKKFVLLLDDIWERLDLEKVGVPHQREANSQSKVLFTTRYEDVCVKMDAKRIFKVEILTEKEALELFCIRVGEETLKSHPIIPKIVEEMAKECKGLPLALTVVGSAMSGVRSVDAWEHSKNILRSSWTASEWETKVFSVLKFSYDRLPDETHKQCFLYCALYPGDYEILVIDLIHKWIGEGFLYNDEMRSVHDMRGYGGSVIERLKLSCMIEMVKDDIFLERSIKMHDVIRGMALWIARDEDENKKKIIVQEDAQRMCGANVEEWEMVERISIMKCVGSFVQSIAWTNLKTLLLKFDIYPKIDGLQNIQYARQLKVLELKGVQIVTYKEIGGLNLLEYLSLEDVTRPTTCFSDDLKNLKNLKVFHLRCEAIPVGIISNLRQLKVFRLIRKRIQIRRSYRDAEFQFLEEVERSSNLEELWVTLTTLKGLNKLFKLTKSQSCIYSLHLTKILAPVNGKFLLSTMSKMEHLHIIGFFGLANVIDPSVDDTCRLSALRMVNIEDCGRIHHLTWLKYAQYLEELHVGKCSSIEEVIKGEILEDEKDAIFPSLEVLRLSNLPNLRSICERVLSFPSLRSIEVLYCENLKKLPFDSNSGKAKLKHITASQQWWDNLEWDDPATKSTFLPKFKDSRVPNIFVLPTNRLPSIADLFPVNKSEASRS